MHDFVIIGSGFGGSVSALRLVEKGYDVVLLEKGRRFAPEDFAKTNWQIWRWLWRPRFGLRGPFAMTFLRHVTVLSGVGLGGGSLVYANTLATPKDEFFAAPSWGALAEWKRELAPHYETALRMLGAVQCPREWPADAVLHQLARDLGREEHFTVPHVAVDFSKCDDCGACMLGCRKGAKNTLDRNYLKLAEERGLRILAETEAKSVEPIAGGYRINGSIDTRNVIFAGGVLGTVPLLLKLKRTSLPKLSERVGETVRTNSEALIGVVGKRDDLWKGVAIGSMLQTDAHSHVEAVRYPRGSGFFRVLAAPFGPFFRSLKAYFTLDWAAHTIILLYMRTLEGALRMTLRNGRLTTAVASGPRPTSDIPEARALARKVADQIDGAPQRMITEALLGTPTTAHILGGACMGDSPQAGVIDSQHRVFNYPGLYVVDGSAISANPGVNPSLTICALAERAMAAIPPASIVQG